MGWREAFSRDAGHEPDDRTTAGAHYKAGYAAALSDAAKVCDDVLGNSKPVLGWIREHLGVQHASKQIKERILALGKE